MCIKLDKLHSLSRCFIDSNEALWSPALVLLFCKTKKNSLCQRIDGLLLESIIRALCIVAIAIRNYALLGDYSSHCIELTVRRPLDRVWILSSYFCSHNGIKELKVNQSIITPCARLLEQDRGFEPPQSAWKAEMLAIEHQSYRMESISFKTNAKSLCNF